MTNKETFLENFREHLKENNKFLQELGIKRVILKPYTQTAYPPDEYSQKILDMADFRKAFLYRARMADMNVVCVLGTQGRGKTNIFKIAIQLGKQLGAPFAWGHNLYIGEQTLIHRKYLVSRHGPGEQIINDEAEFEFRPNSTQTRDLMWTLSSGRDSLLHFWFCFPTIADTPFRIWLAHANWLFWVTKREQDNRRVKYTLYYKISFDSPFATPEWVEYPYPGATFYQSFLSQKSFDEYKEIKDRIYDIDRVEDWYLERKQLDKEIRDKAKKKTQKELLEEVDRILNLKLTIPQKVIQLDLIGYQKYKIVERLHISNAKVNLILEDQLIDEIDSRGEKNIFISTKREFIEEEMKENLDNDYEDFWPVGKYPKDLIMGKSRLYLTVKQEMVASFIIEEMGEREWRGRMKKVLLLKKESVRREKGKIDKPAAPRGGYRYF